MSTITQNIPNFLNGISQQQDTKKHGTQLKDAVNTFPDYALGMLKRPGGKFVSDLYNAEPYSTTIKSNGFTHNGEGHNSRTVGDYIAVASTGGSGSGATFNVTATRAGTINAFTHNGVGDGSRSPGYYAGAATSGGSGSGATFDVHATAAGEVATFTHNAVAASNRSAGTYTVANAAGSASGTGADFTVVVGADGQVRISITLGASAGGGAGYVVDETITIADSSLGSGGADAVVLTVTSIHALGVTVTKASGGAGFAAAETITIADSALGTGGGAAITVTISSIHELAVSVALSSGGKGYLKGDILTISDSVLGGGGGPNITVTVGSSTGNYGRWFSILRDENEKYIGQYADDTFRVWSLIDGSPRKVDMGSDTGVPTNCVYANLQENLLTYNTTVATTLEETEDLNTAQAAFAEATDGQEFTKTALWETSQDYDKGLGLITETLVSGISQISTNDTYTIKKNGDTFSLSANAISAPVYKLERLTDGDAYSEHAGRGRFNQGNISVAGTGYSDAAGATTTVTTAGSTGSGLTLKTTTGAGAITGIEVVNTGIGYQVGDVIQVNGGGNNARVIVDKVLPGNINTLSMTSAGSGYTNGTHTGIATTVSPAGGSQCTVNIVVESNAVSSVTINRPGSGYAINDIITINGAGGSNSTWVVTKLGVNTTTTGSGEGLTVDITTDTGDEVEPLIQPSDVTTISTFTHNGVAVASRVAGNYTAVTGTANRAGTGALFDVVVDANGEPTVTLLNGGEAYNTSETITIADASLGSGGAAAIVVTVATTSIKKSGGGLTTTTGYKEGDTIAITNTANSGVVTLGTITAAGAGYNTGMSAQATTSTNGTGLTVNITAVNSDGGITALSVVADGSGYYPGDVITVTGGTAGSLATVPVATTHEATAKVTELMWQRGKEMTSENPHLASSGRKLYELIEVNPPTHTSAALTTTESAMATAQTAYDTAVSAEAAAKTNYDAEITACTIPGLPTNGYLRGATADDIELLTLNDYTYVLNKSKVVSMTADKTDALPNEAFIVIYITAYNSKYEVIINGVTVSFTTAQDSSAGDSDATVIVAGLVSAINGAGGDAASCVASAVGPGIHVTLVTSIKVSGGPQENAMFAFTDKITDISRLPVQCKDGFKVKVVNSENVLADDMWVQFTASNNQASGPGAWEESNEPEITYKFDPLTMPHQLVRQADGSFKFDPIAWENRDVGDELSNPTPSFVGSTIRNMFFFRNRFGFLSGGEIIMSKAASFYDFWAGSAQSAVPDDPIDISASSTKPVFLNYVKTISAGLVIFSDTEQFLLSTDSDILSPTTAKVNTLSAYECDTNIEAVNMGTSVGFLSKTPLYSRLFEIANISTTDPPTTFNTTGIVPELVPSTVDNIAGSPGMSMISLGTTGNNTLYQYRFYQATDKRVASTWYKWNLTGTLIDQFFDTSTFYAIVSDGTNVSVNSIDLRQASETGFLTLPTGEKTDVCMDMWNSNPYRTYNTTTEKTRVFLPFTHITGKTLTVVALGGYIQGTLGASDASVGAILYPTVGGSAGSEYVDIDGDYRGKNLIIGYIYTMTVEIPKLYYNKKQAESSINDYTSDLIIHRIKVATGLSGPVKYNVNLTGIPNRTQTVSVVQPATYALNDVAMTADSIHEVPVYQRNENVSLSIVGDTPLPISLLGMTWEGKYNNKFYTRT